MVQRVAMTAIRLLLEAGQRKTDKSPAVPAKYQEIKAGTLFEVPPDLLAGLEEGQSPAVVKITDKRAAKFGYGSEAAQQVGVEAEEGETDASATKRRTAARAAATRTATKPAAGKAKGGRGRKDDLVG